MPAVVIGPTVAIIGLSLAGNAIGDLQTSNYVLNLKEDDYQIIEVASNYKIDKDDDGNEFYNFNVAIDGENEVETVEMVVSKDVDITKPVPATEIRSDISINRDEDGKLTGLSTVPGSVYVAIICGLVTLLATIIASVFGKNMAKMIPFIIGIIAGYAVAGIFTAIGTATENYALCIINFSPFNDLQWVPKFTFMSAFDGIKDITPAYIGTVAVAYVPVAFVVFAEHLADHKNISSIIETNLLEEPGLHRTLLGDGVGSMAGAFFGGCPNTTYGESIGCVAISGNASIVTILATAILAIIVSFFAPFVAFLSTIPSCVMGGVCIALYGFIAVSGLKMLQPVDLNDNRNLFTAAVILIAGIGGLTLTFGKVTITTIACALILGIIVNLIVSCKKGEKAEAEAKE
ncbi:MAG: hypothetical protein J5852_02555 [Clostridia bacterium]|nr:hypothetical protein [Clostridia bacterium]